MLSTENVWTMGHFPFWNTILPNRLTDLHIAPIRLLVSGLTHKTTGREERSLAKTVREGCCRRVFHWLDRAEAAPVGQETRAEESSRNPVAVIQ